MLLYTGGVASPAAPCRAVKWFWGAPRRGLGLAGRFLHEDLLVAKEMNQNLWERASEVSSGGGCAGLLGPPSRAGCARGC